MDDKIDKVVNAILSPIIKCLEAILGFLFANHTSTLITGFVFMNLMGYILMYSDKRIAKENENIQDEKKKTRRIPESTLFITAILFGSLGILAGMYKFRHKTKHKSFTIGIPIIIVLQIIFVIWTIISNTLLKS